MNSVELFAGAGGLALGVAQAGFRHVAVIERDAAACVTIEKNSDWPLFQTDARAFDYSTISKPIALLSAGPPCQPFSLGGRGLANADVRDMFPEAIRAIRDLKPKAFILENVKGILRVGVSSYLDYVRLQLKFPDIVIRSRETAVEHLMRLERTETSGPHGGLEYNVLTKFVNAADYGVPQVRERVFIVGFRRDVRAKWSLPPPTHSHDSLLWSQWVTGEYGERHQVMQDYLAVPKGERERVDGLSMRPSDLPWLTTRDSICDLPIPTAAGDEHFANHVLIPGAREYKGHTGSELDQPAKTLKAGVHGVPGGENMVVGPDRGVRYFTVRECARLQTFPDSYEFHCAWGSAVKQIGNAVPVVLAKVIAESVFKSLRIATRKSP